MMTTTTPTAICLATEIAGISGIRAAAFDFNGTITDDEQLQYEVYAETFLEETGVRLTYEFYQSRLAGRSDPEIISTVLSRSGLRASAETLSHIAKLRVDRYVRRVSSSPPVRAGVVALINELAYRIPLAVVTGAPRAEAFSVLSAARLDPLLVTTVTSDEVVNGKPHPEGYLLALQRFRAVIPDLVASEVVVFEDSTVGLAAARAAGMKCVAVHLPADNGFVNADYVTEVLDERILLNESHRN
jgi:beta-phosphoglucomutase